MLQGREQMHAKLEKLCPSLKQMDYTDFMHFFQSFLWADQSKEHEKDLNTKLDMLNMFLSIFLVFIKLR